MKLKERQGKLVEAVQGGAKLRDAMRSAGYPESTVKRGKLGIGKTVLSVLAATVGSELAEIGKTLTADHVENAIAGKAYTAMLQGDSKGLEGAKLLGSMAKYNLFASEQSQAVIILQAPQTWLEMAEVQKPGPKQLECEVVPDTPEKP